MPTLSGTIQDVTGATLAASDIVRIYVKAPTARTDSDALVVSSPVHLSPSGALSLNVRVGDAVLVVVTRRSIDRYVLRVAADMTSLATAVVGRA